MPTKKTEVATDHDSAMDAITRSVADRLHAQIQDAEAELELITMTVAAESRDLTFLELNRIRQLRPSWDDKSIRREMRRCRSVRQLQAVAGDFDSRAALTTAVEKSTADLASRGPALRGEIERLTAELASMEKSHDSLVRRQGEVASALEKLSESLPESVTKALASEQRDAGSTLQRERLDIESELRHRENLRRGPRPNMEFDWHQSMRRFGVNVLSAQGREVADQQSLQALYSRWDSEEPVLRSRVAELQDQLATIEADIAAKRGLYFR